MPIKVCDHEPVFESLGNNLWRKSWSHPENKMGNRVRHDTPGPVGYDVYTKEEIDEKLEPINKSIGTNSDDIKNGLQSTLNSLNNIKSHILSDKNFQAAIVELLMENEEFKKLVIKTMTNN